MAGRTLRVTVKPLVGTTVPIVVMRMANEKVSQMMETGATSGEFRLDPRYVATGQNETDSYTVEWAIKNWPPRPSVIHIGAPTHLTSHSIPV